ncbi:hypothetical protein BDN72DRAFT_882387 [Pluteus cervinus]|uniref:Uncharacterized protein n=1 Tax=Pluteus cervinus TaxID=181527 RepID=A0ACD3ABG1_9AGAR|nr:hypothetical protein BDN72DRAFT_882387 [Pluteus cervinus]
MAEPHQNEEEEDSQDGPGSFKILQTPAVRAGQEDQVNSNRSAFNLNIYASSVPVSVIQSGTGNFSEATEQNNNSLVHMASARPEENAANHQNVERPTSQTTMSSSSSHPNLASHLPHDSYQTPQRYPNHHFFPPNIPPFHSASQHQPQYIPLEYTQRPYVPAGNQYPIWPTGIPGGPSPFYPDPNLPPQNIQPELRELGVRSSRSRSIRRRRRREGPSGSESLAGTQRTGERMRSDSRVSSPSLTMNSVLIDSQLIVIQKDLTSDMSPIGIRVIEAIERMYIYMIRWVMGTLFALGVLVALTYLISLRLSS